MTKNERRLRLNGRVAFVTGGARGLGAAVVRALSSEGAAVAVADVDPEPAEELVESVRDAGGRARAWQLDVTSGAETYRVAAEAARELGAVDILVAAAGIASSGRSVVDTEPGEIERLFAIHTMGAIHAARAVVPGMRTRRRGDLVFFSSIATHRFDPKSGPYAAVKLAVEGLARTIAAEEKSHGIRSNIIAPAMFESRLAREVLERVRASARKRGLPEPTEEPQDPAILAATVVDVIADPDPRATGRRFAVGLPGGLQVS